MSDLVMNSVELVSTLRTAPQNGSSSSVEYNDSQREILADLAAVVAHLNEVLSPMLTTLPEGAATGIEGRTVHAARVQTDPLFWSATAERYLTIAEVLSNLNSRSVSQDVSIKNVQAQLASLRTKLATTNGNDMVNSIQGFSDQVRQLALQLNSIVQASETHTNTLAGFKTARETTGAVAGGDSVEVEIDWLVPFPDNAYTVSVSVEDEDNDLIVVNFFKRSDGLGVTVVVENPSLLIRTGTVHLMAKADA